jgi:hypothetical protein
MRKGGEQKNLAVKWLTEVWDKTTPGALLTKRMLVLDDFKGHLTSKVKTQLLI